MDVTKAYIKGSSAKVELTYERLSRAGIYMNGMTAPQLHKAVP